MPMRFVLILTVMFLLPGIQAVAQQAVEPPHSTGEPRVVKDRNSKLSYGREMHTGAAMGFDLCRR